MPACWPRLAALALGLGLLAACAQAPVTTPTTAPIAAATPAAPPTGTRSVAPGCAGSACVRLSEPDSRWPWKSLKAIRRRCTGAAALAGLVRTLREQAPGGAAHSLLLASGDQIGAAPLVSALFRHESTIEVLNALGVDVATVGNHEFDAGQAELKRVLGGGCAPNRADAATQSCALRTHAGARFPSIVANVDGADGQPLYAPSWVREFGGVRVGFIGAVTRSTPGIVVPSAVAGLRFGDEAQAINRAAQALQAEGVQALVALIHEGGEIGSAQQPGDWNDESCPELRGSIVDIARRVTPAVDVLFTAHTHQGYRCVIDGRPVVQATSYGRGVSVVDLVLDARSGDVDRTQVRSRNLPVFNASTPAAARAA